MKSEGTVGCETKCSLHGNPEYSGDSLIKLGWPFIAGEKKINGAFPRYIYPDSPEKCGYFSCPCIPRNPALTRINENRRADRRDSTESVEERIARWIGITPD